MKGIVTLLIVIIGLMAAHSLLSGATIAAQQQGNYVQLARTDAQEAGIDPDIFVRQIRQESGFQPNAVSAAGAIGIAQLMPETARGLGINPYDPAQSLAGAAQLMARYMHTYGSEALALAAYNAGSGTVNRCLHTHNWYACLPGETQQYITAIL